MKLWTNDGPRRTVLRAAAPFDGNPLQDLAAVRRLRAAYAGGVPVIPAPVLPARAEAR